MKTTWTTWAAAMIAVVATIPLGCTGSVVEIGSQPPGCPDAEPVAGAACSVTAAGCKYTEGPCAVELRCDAESAAWQSKTTSCSPVAKDCGSGQDGDVCAVIGETCGESPGPCSGGYFNTCGDDHHWHSSVAEGGGPCCDPSGVCPAEQPTQGQPCSPCPGEPACSYSSGCGQNFASCDPDGTWHIIFGDCPPPPPPDNCTNLGNQGACETDPSCRWLTPGCGDVPIGAPGCFTIKDCGPGTCGPSEICQTFSYNPCFNKGCDACGAPAQLCVGGL
ncbi:MAG: hypothetical protein ABJE95_11130 [Byssovorax sp.]